LNLEIVSTKDGSNTVYSSQFDEHYHSIHGAKQESEHVFIRNGFNQFKHLKNLAILEIGFGTGFNCLLTLLANTTKHIYYHGIEAYPIDTATHKIFKNHLHPNEQLLYESVSSTPWNTPSVISENITLLKEHTTFQTMNLKKTYDLIYFDAFSPRKQPECWTIEILTACYHALKPQGKLVTYCAKGSIKRSLKKSGFLVETLQGPPGKREMVRAIKTH
tara:strand:+ start:547 stop:1200 length:654 start_codon:yes stop_codon:yes gene_type:complete